MTSKNVLMLLALMLVAIPMFAADSASGPMVIPGSLSMAIASGLCGLAQGKAVASSAEAIARNPGAASIIRGTLLLGLVLIESLALYTLVIIFIR